jgi:hypothetical protein
VAAAAVGEEAAVGLAVAAFLAPVDFGAALAAIQKSAIR